MTTWIFQANPDRYNIDGFLATRPGTTNWLVTRLGKEMKVGDQVYLWRAIGKGDASKAGIIAEAEIVSNVERQLDDPKGRAFWLDKSEGDVLAERVSIRLVRVATKREIIQRSWIVEDPLLRDLEILKLANGTNYRVPPVLSARLQVLWDKTGQDWTYAEAVAGLWAYEKTLGKEVSKLPGSPVAQVSLLIGRAVGGVYNKVMNFRSLDPRETRKGLTGGSEVDRSVWAEFFLPEKKLDASALDHEMVRLWSLSPNDVPIDAADAAERAVETAANALTGLTLFELLAAYQRGQSKQRGKPRAKRSSTRTFERDPLVVAIALARANRKCEVAGCSHDIFLDENGLPFCEVHHIVPLAEGGEDTPENVACVCPSHHREAHHGKIASAIRDLLLSLRKSNALIATVS